ncbi:uncharacterized protein LOC119139966 [Falco rusticolus]|uniref:uncharacterized protein LOC119139966 n=1 Tax=Falco rusticolus TaxID=120794 RepID=UPI00188693BC|nr:uncharacterized protein LOC119139966 [Falco rusticolus]
MTDSFRSQSTSGIAPEWSLRAGAGASCLTGITEGGSGEPGRVREEAAMALGPKLLVVAVNTFSWLLLAVSWLLGARGGFLGRRRFGWAASPCCALCPVRPVSAGPAFSGSSLQVPSRGPGPGKTPPCAPRLRWEGTGGIPSGLGEPAGLWSPCEGVSVGSSRPGPAAPILFAQQRFVLPRGISGTAGAGVVSAPEDRAGLSEGRGPGRARGGSIQRRINFSLLSVDQFHLKRA